ncbi:hypothetical protein CbC4_7006 (plasmid) [Clostridium botulinum BKT015925]|nr:hypothetical protein CbC4_7006 [Clostridium botulinum BKT015925]
MINYLIKSFLNTYVPRNTTCVEELLYYKEAYPIYAQTKGNFNYAIKNKLLSRQDILQIKKMLNQALFKRRHLKDYSRKNLRMTHTRFIVSLNANIYLVSNLLI